MWEYPNRPEPEYPYAASIKWAFGFVLSQSGPNLLLTKLATPARDRKGNYYTIASTQIGDVFFPFFLNNPP